jgi:hypothetical protein
MLASCNRALDPGVGPHGLVVQASLSAATLADDCAAKSPPSSAGSCAVNVPCGSPCQQSNVLVALDAEPGRGPVAVEIVAVRLLSSDGKLLDHLDARDPTIWTGSSYGTWDGELAAASSIKAGWNISAPHWADFSDARAPSITYRVEVDLSIDGVLRTLSLDGVTREPIIST